MAEGEGVNGTGPDRDLIESIERHRANVREFGRDCRQSSYSGVMDLLAQAARPIEEARETMRQLREVHGARCYSATAANHLAGAARRFEQRLHDLRGHVGPHEALLELLLVAYRQLAARRGDRVLLPEEDAAITEALRRYAEADV